MPLAPMRLALLTLAVAGCTTARPDTAAAPGPPPAASEPVVMLERTPCYGRCPAYTVAAYADGRVVWTGAQHVGTTGPSEWRVAPAVVAGLVRQAETARHAAFPAMLDGPVACPSFHTDGAGAVTTVRTAEAVHTVTHNRGCRGFAGEAALVAFEDAIDRDLGTTPRVAGANPDAPR
ncbi:MAG TPA: DUF6438 domain-containing protein [Rubricoccaceae bacterium]|jgi:hypothetical protein